MPSIISQELRPTKFDVSGRWPDRHVPDEDGNPVPFHQAQEIAYDAQERIVALIAGSQGGKTGFGPQKLWQWIQRDGGGDWYAITSTYDLFKLKMLPSLIHFFVEQLGIARYWAGDRVLEMRDPSTGLFWASRAAEPMWGRIILRSADSKGGIEAGTAKGAWLDEAGQEKFDLKAWQATRRRLAISQGPILLTSTLYEFGWVDDKIIDRAKKGGNTWLVDTGRGEIEVTENPDSDVTLIQFDSTVNPVFPPEEMAEAEAEMPDSEFQAFYRGRRVSSELMVYDCFDKELNTTPPFAIPEDWPRYLGIDPGGANLAAIMLAERPTDLTLFAYREYLAGGRTTEEHAKKLLSGEPGFLKAYIGAKGEGQWRRDFRGHGLAGLPPGISDFDVGVSRVYAQFSTRKLILFETLTGTIEQVTKYRRKRDRQGTITNVIENKPTFHYLDALRYPVCTLRPGRRPKAKILRLDDGGPQESGPTGQRTGT